MPKASTIRIGRIEVSLEKEADSLSITVPDVQGTYRIPYIQGGRKLEFEVLCLAEEVTSISIEAIRGEEKLAFGTLTKANPAMIKESPATGNYDVLIREFDRVGGEIGAKLRTGLGIGLVAAAIGDSITEGYYGRTFMREDLRLDASQFPNAAVSKDGRNFPQFAPTTHVHLPQINCMQSWMTDLNDRLSSALKYPVFIANEGWGGYTSADYLQLMRSDTNWRGRIGLLRPNLWLVHLGVNDERAKRPPGDLAADLRAIVEILINEYGAEPSRILVAKPCHDYFEGAEPILRSYCMAIDELVAGMSLSAGPDFFDAYSSDRKRFYGDDPVHPNEEGMRMMAELWRDAVMRCVGNCEGGRK
ncbi:MAG TPA: SGNH/GDSL hydrolase family protein [Candidatus Brocadiia bacterium]|nr:SGNH/GDSL hydrolase family protein [Candidatus Brocadiia bacterium]